MAFCPADLIDAEVSNLSAGNSGSGNYTTVAFEDGVGKGATITPAKGDTSKKLLLPNAGTRPADGSVNNHAYFFCIWSTTQRTVTNAWYFYFWNGVASGYMNSYTKLDAHSLRCVRS